MHTEHERSTNPDGLDRARIDALIREVYAELASAPHPTSALLDGSAAERRHRRVERRAVHVLPSGVDVDQPNNEVAA